MKRTSLSYSKVMCVFLTTKNIIEKNSLFYCAIIEVKWRGKNRSIYVRIFTKFDNNSNVFKVIGIWVGLWIIGTIGCVLQSLFQSGLSCPLAKAKAKGHAESNQRLININVCSAKDKGLNLEPDEQSRNSKLFFPKALNIM